MIIKSGYITILFDVQSIVQLSSFFYCFRHHAVLQYKARDTEDDRPRGFYVYDMGSSHGTFVNKTRLKASHYARVMVGHMLKLGCSTRQYILQVNRNDALATYLTRDITMSFSSIVIFYISLNQRRWAKSHY